MILGMNRYKSPKSVKRISVIEVKVDKGLGIEKDPVREVTQYWDMDGNFLAEKGERQQDMKASILIALSEVLRIPVSEMLSFERNLNLNS